MQANAWARWLPRLVLAVSAGAIAAAVTIAPALEDAPSHVLEIQMAASTGGALQVFYDRGDGLNETDSVATSIGPSADPHTLRLPLPLGHYRLFRIDPNDRPGRYVFTSLRILNGDDVEVARIPLEAITPAAQVTLEPIGPGGLAIVTTPDATDPQVVYTPPGALVLVPNRADMARSFAWAGGIAFALLLLAILLDRPASSGSALKAAARFAHRRPYSAVVLAGVVGTLAATYPLLLGQSLVSPGNGSTNLLYDQPPFTFGSDDPGVENPRGTDVGAMMWAILPYTVVQREALAHGEWPLWNRYNTIGEPLWGQGQTFILDPFHLASLAIPDPALAMDLRFIVGRAVFAVGSGLTVALVTGNGMAAVLVTLMAPFVGHFTARFNHPAYFSIIYAPWILFAYARLARVTLLGDRLRAGAFLAAASWMQLVGGTPKEGLIALAAAHVAGIAGLLVAPGPWRDKLGRLDAAMLGGVVTVLLGAPHWLIFLDTLNRSWTGYDMAAVQLGGWPHVIGYVFGGAVPGTPLTGVHPLVVMAAACTLFYPRQLAASGAGLGALLAVVMVGGSAFGLVPPDVLVTLPLISNIHHVANTFLAATVAPLLLVAGVGLAAVLDEPPGGPPLRLSLAVAAATIALALVLPGAALQTTTLVGMAGIVGAAVALLMVAVLRAAPTPSGAAAIALASATAMFAGGLQFETGVGAVDALLIQPRLRADLDEPSPALRSLLAHSGGEPFRVAPVDAVLFPGTQAYWNLEGIGGPDALRLPDIEALSDATGVERTPWLWRTVLHPESLTGVGPFLDMINVRYLVSRPDQVPPGASPLPMDGADRIRVVERPTAWPRAYFSTGVGRHRGVAEFAGRLQIERRPFSSVDEQDLSAVEAVRTLPRTGAVTPASTYRLTPNTTSFRVKTTAEGVAVLAEAYVEDDFQATLNGKNVPYFRVNNGLKGVLIPGAGDWDVSFAYEPRRWFLSWILSVLGMTGIAIMVLARPLLTSSVNRH